MNKPIMRAAAVHDISGFGKCSLTVIIPILSAMGIEVNPLTTAVLSTHTGGFDNYTFVDLTYNMESYINHWKSINLQFDCIYTGFLGSEKQIDIVEEFIKSFKRENQLIVIDPVLGDDGYLYSSMNQSMIEEMRKLIRHADIITPNPTEANMLLGNNCNYSSINEKNIKNYLIKLSDMGPKKVIITSVPDSENSHIGWVTAYDRETSFFWRVKYRKMPIQYPGTGDILTSVITGSILKGESLPVAIDRGVQFVSNCIDITIGHGYPVRNGLIIEKSLTSLNTSQLNFTFETF